ncbi:hypothetical protein [Longimicrobium sp.]|uniref:hypothetical protein n=1 Tax=Longimicrobium sp. TaxID=2029185 RepID=UPI002E34DC1C|nr:hypothetical protein [Longimicrobium sp.]HEX6039152.1 hypothetical protein [Longimicrobium sp.]
MSAPALRAPASALRVAAAEARALLASRGLVLLTAAVVALSVMPSRAEHPFPWAPVANLLQIMIILPLLHWRGAGAARGLDTATPIGSMRYELIRFGVGAGAALAVLVTVALAHAWTVIPDLDPRALDTLPFGYAAALVIRGLAYYGFGSLAVLRGRGQGLGPVLLGTVVVVTVVQVAGRVGTQTGWYTHSQPPGQPPVVAGYTASLTLGAALAELAAAVAAVCVLAWYGARERNRPRLPWLSGIETMASPRATPDARVRALPRRPVSVLKVAARQFMAHAPRMMLWPMFAIVTTAGSLVSSIRYDRPWLGQFSQVGSFVFLVAAFFWPLLARGSGRGEDWEQALPAGILAQRVLQWGVGLAWLQLWTVLLVADHIAGERARGASVDAWELLQLPVAFLAFYCLGTLPAMIRRHTVGWSIVGWMIVMSSLSRAHNLGIHPGALSPLHLFATVLDDDAAWSPAAALLWTPVLVALALLAIYLRVRWDRRPPALPRVPMRRVLTSRS